LETCALPTAGALSRRGDRGPRPSHFWAVPTAGAGPPSRCSSDVSTRYFPYGRTCSLSRIPLSTKFFPPREKKWPVRAKSRRKGEGPSRNNCRASSVSEDKTTKSTKFHEERIRGKTPSIPPSVLFVSFVVKDPRRMAGSSQCQPSAHFAPRRGHWPCSYSHVARRTLDKPARQRPAEHGNVAADMGDAMRWLRHSSRAKDPRLPFGPAFPVSGCRLPATEEGGPRTRDQGPETRNHGPRTRDHGPAQQTRHQKRRGRPIGPPRLVVRLRVRCGR
jgi:hypothetical protein